MVHAREVRQAGGRILQDYQIEMKNIWNTPYPVRDGYDTDEEYEEAVAAYELAEHLAEEEAVARMHEDF